MVNSNYSKSNTNGNYLIDIVFGMKKKSLKKFIYHIFQSEEIEGWYIDRFETFLYFHIKNKKEA